ncbi:MAG: J domain-containing protein [Clostridia bacterium]|nr:J domain-containing protein [Clostridia bacterium]
MTDPYQLLGVSSSATDDEVKAAYRRLAKKYHPDHNNGSPEAERMMMQVNDAYAQIMDMRKNGGSSSYSSGGWGNPYGGYSQSGYGNYGGNGYSGAQRFAIVRQYLSMGRYFEALQILQQMNEHSAEWYYLCARARQGLGDDISALNFARQAANMDPGNREYTDFVNDLMAGGEAYRQQGVNFGGIQNAVCGNPCLTCLLFNMCCGGGCGGLRFCLCPC